MASPRIEPATSILVALLIPLEANNVCDSDGAVDLSMNKNKIG
jgi:hypothetical protein